jgi:cysteine desulfurase
VIYLDHNASTPTDPRVVDAMLPWFTDLAANAASVDHRSGHEASQAVESAREKVATLVGARSSEVIFTSGATEADNIALLGAMARAAPDAELVVSAIEHPAVLEPAQSFGDRLRIAPVDRDGRVDPDALAALLSPRTALVSVMAANNETGVIQPLEEIGRRCAVAGVPLHVDAAQAAGRIPTDAGAWGASLVSLSAHKMNGPLGSGALVVRRAPVRVRLAPLLRGGGHERGLRPGSLNVPAIVGFGAAAELVGRERGRDALRMSALRDGIIGRLPEIHPDAEVNGDPAHLLPQTLNVRLPGVNARALLRLVSRDLAIATGSACTTTSVEPSHVLIAMGRAAAEVAECVRISFGPRTTADELEQAMGRIAGAVSRLLALGEAA